MRGCSSERVQLEAEPAPETEPAYRHISIGVDVGKTRDPTAIVVAEALVRERDDGRRTEDIFEVRDLGRLPIGTPYPMVADRLVDVVDRVSGQLVEEGARGTPWLVIDATGVGEPVADELRAALSGHHVAVSAAILTGGSVPRGPLRRPPNDSEQDLDG
jgi:hypothetical protein